MSIRDRLPSARFAVTAASLLCAGGLVFAAELLTTPAAPARLAVAPSSAASTGTGWEATLYAIQGAQSASAPEIAGTDPTPQLLAAAQSSNITDTVSRSLLINLSNATAQGMAGNTQTQSQLVAQAAAQLQPQTHATRYAQSDLSVVDNSNAALRAYGNAVMAALGRHAAANSRDVIAAVAQATDNQDPKFLDKLGIISGEYAALARELRAIPVPSTLAPLHLQAANTMAQLADSVADAENVLTDPLRGLAGLQQYQTLMSEEGRVFTDIAQLFSKDAIIFNNDEAGSAWSVFLAPSP